MSGAAIEVKAPVFVKVGPVDLRLYQFEEGSRFDGEDCWERPWKWWAMVRLYFTIGELSTSKRVVQSYAWYTRTGWAQQERPSDHELMVGRETVLANLRNHVARHGFDPPEFVVLESDYSKPAPLLGMVERGVFG